MIITHIRLYSHYFEVINTKHHFPLSLSPFYGPNDKKSKVMGFSLAAHERSLVSIM